MIAIGWCCGLRASEMIALQVFNYSVREHTLLIEDSKGSVTDSVPVLGFAEERLKKWIEVRGRTPGTMFLQTDMNGTIHIRDTKNGRYRRTKPLLRGDAISTILSRRINEAGLERFTWHDLRRTVATDMIRDAGVAVARQLLRHCSEATTLGYARISKTEVRAAMELRERKFRRMEKQILEGQESRRPPGRET